MFKIYINNIFIISNLFSRNLMETIEIKFDILKIDEMIKQNDVYEEGDNKFQFYKEYNPDSKTEQGEDFPKYIARVKSNSFRYLGILSKNLKKELYGYNCYDNGDEYFGQWNKDKKEGYGIYYYKEPDVDEIKQIYVGEFKNNIKSGEGIYFHISKLEQEEDIFIPIDFSLAIGQFLEDNFIKGIIFTIKDGKSKIYKGKINKEGKKDDENAELYEGNNKIFHGIFKDNNICEGRIIIIRENQKDNRNYYFNKINDDDDIKVDYEKGKEKDEMFIKKLNELNDIFKYEKIKDLFIDIIKIKIKACSSNNFDYLKNLDYELDIKQNLKEQYGKYLYC